jgi:peptidoglycan L-alanyl-D-glutamate endopeptidase CwlK
VSAKYAWGARSLSRLSECDGLLRELFFRVIAREDLPFDLTVLCGYRDQKEQDAAFASGNSKLRWPKSKHNRVPSLAVDVAPFIGGKANHKDWALYNRLAPIVKDEWGKMRAEGMIPDGEDLEWGGDFKSLKDGPHWQLA